MSNVDIQYNNLVKEILENGYYDNNRTGIPTKKVFGKTFEFDLQREFPIITSKFVAFKHAVKEMLWIYKYQSNDVNFLKEKLGVRVWDEWKKEDGTIGPAYGAQVKKHKQIDKLIDGLKTNPQGRRHIISLWDMNDLDDMALQPCAFMTMWDVNEGFLNCTLVQRSTDVGLGLPFNFSQYSVLIHMIAQVTNLKPGKFIHYMNNAHIYENHIPVLEKQLTLPIYESPKLRLNPDIKNFYDFELEDIELIGYEHGPKLKMDVAV